jgi:hypothetical protein
LICPGFGKENDELETNSEQLEAARLWYHTVDLDFCSLEQSNACGYGALRIDLNRSSK